MSGTAAPAPAPGVRWGRPLARLIAYLVDGFILAALVGVTWGAAVALMAASISPDGTASPLGVAGVVVLVVGLAVGFAYKPWFWSHGGRTPGYRVAGLRMVRLADGGPVGGAQAVGRLLGYIISGAVLYIGFLWILFDGKHQGWHDKLAGTVVIEA